MAQCRECHKSVGCSCNLKNGLCINCLTIQQNKQILKESEPTPIKNEDTSKILIDVINKS